MRGLEFGSGRSTRWLARRVESLISVEHVEDWHRVVRQQLGQASIQNVDVRMIPLDHAEAQPEQAHYETTPRYVAVLDEAVDGSLDFVLVDGHYRSACIRKCLTKIRCGGLLVVDDTNLWATAGGPPVPPEWDCVDSSTNGTKTAQILRRPGEPCPPSAGQDAARATEPVVR
jgi:predicted O-methyltransferase YrrM